MTPDRTLERRGIASERESHERADYGASALDALAIRSTAGKQKLSRFTACKQCCMEVWFGIPGLLVQLYLPLLFMHF